MPSYLITGAGRGIGFGFLDHLSKDARNIVIGLVRNKAAVDMKVAEELTGRTNIHILQGDMTDHRSLKNAVEKATSITGGSLDVLIANANPVFYRSIFDALGENAVDDPALQDDLLRAFNTNVVGNIYLTNNSLPLIRKGALKKMVYVSTAMGDIDFCVQQGLHEAAPYSISKAALNMMVAKYHATHKDEGILFMAISPGVVDSGGIDISKFGEEETAKMAIMFDKFKSYAPDMGAPISVEESVDLVLGVVDNATIERNGGQMVSHLGSKRWI